MRTEGGNKDKLSTKKEKEEIKKTIKSGGMGRSSSMGEIIGGMRGEVRSRRNKSSHQQDAIPGTATTRAPQTKGGA